jgi:hypothetical protein
MESMKEADVVRLHSHHHNRSSLCLFTFHLFSIFNLCYVNIFLTYLVTHPMFFLLAKLFLDLLSYI